MGANLITRNEYKAYAGISSTNQDSQIDTLIPIVSELVKSICRRSFVDYIDEALVEVFDGGEAFDLKEYPVLSVQSVEYSSDYGNTYTELTEFTDYYIHKKTETIRPVDATSFTDTPNGFRVTYFAGFEVLPSDLKIAVMDLVTYYLKNETAIKSSKSPGSNTVQIEYVTTSRLPSHISRVLDLYTANYL